MAIDGARLGFLRKVTAHLLIAGTEMPGSGSTMLDVLSNEYLAPPSPRRSVLVEPGQHGLSIRFTKQGGSIVERLTAVHMDARTCSRVSRACAPTGAAGAAAAALKPAARGPTGLNETVTSPVTDFFEILQNPHDFRKIG